MQNTIDVLYEQNLKEAERLFNTSTKKTNSKIFDNVYSQYTNKEINNMLDTYLNSQYDYSMQIKEGNIYNGKLIKATADDYIFDIGYKDYVYVDNKKDETRIIADYADENGNLFENTKIDIKIQKVSYSPYMIRGSLAAINIDNIYKDMIDVNDNVYDAHVDAIVNMGFNVTVNVDGYKIKSFMPNRLGGINKLTPNQIDNLLDKDIKVMVDSYTDDDNSFVVSRKKYLQSLISDSIKNLKNKNNKGEFIKFTGEVTGTTKFGIFVQIDEVLTSMIYIDNVDDETKARFNNIQQGDSINFYIKDIIGNKLFLTQTLKETIWDIIEKDQIYDGVVLSEKSSGVLVRLDKETIGMIPKNKINKTLTIGDTVKVKINNVNKQDRKIFLNLI